MDITIHPRKLSGKLNIIPSKSQAHRLLICAAFSDGESKLICNAVNQDIEATADCLRALGADIRRTQYGYDITPADTIPGTAVLNCRESGSTLRFMLPVVAALGVDAIFQMEGRLPYRPLSPLWEELERMGCTLCRPTETTIRCQGRLHPGEYSIDGSVSSQFITGLLYAMALLPGKSKLNITGKIESKPYIAMTQQALNLFGVNTTNFTVTGSYPFPTPGCIHVEGDWSNGAFWLTANFLGNNIDLSGLDVHSAQGDRAVLEILRDIENIETVNAADIPDLVPILAVAAGAKNGITFQNIGRLRLKESDRVATVAAMIEAFGGSVDISADNLTICPTKYHGCSVDTSGDHRIAMAAAIAATVTDGPVTIHCAQCVAKSYPSFWEEYARLGASYEQHIR